MCNKNYIYEEEKMKAIVLAGGYDQINLIEKLKERGYEVILVDYYLNPPAAKYADKHIQLSTLDESAVHCLAKEEKADLVITACTDQALLTAARVSENLNLPFYLTYEQALNVTNKKYMKEKMIQANIPTAKAKIVTTAFSKEDAESYLEYPYVVKPCDCNSSKGVKKVYNLEELYNAVQTAQEMSRSNTAIIEEFISGKEISIDAWIEKGQGRILSVTNTKKINESEDKFTICQSNYPAVNGNNDYIEIENIIAKISQEFKIKNAPLLVQAISNKKGIFVIEFSARMGGGSKYSLIKKISGVDIMEKYISLILDNKYKIGEVKKSKSYIEVDYLYTQEGVLKEIEGIKEMIQDGDIDEYYQYKEPGMKLSLPMTSSDRVAGIMLSSNDKKELEEKRKRVLENIHVLDKQGNDVLVRNLY